MNLSFSFSPLHPEQHYLGSSGKEMAPKRVWEEFIKKKHFTEVRAILVRVGAIEAFRPGG